MFAVEHKRVQPGIKKKLMDIIICQGLCFPVDQTY